MSGKKTTALLIVIFAVAIFVRILSFGGYEGSDDMVYVNSAYRMSKGDFKLGEDYAHPPVFHLRKGLFAPIALGFRLFGPSEGIALSYPFAVSILGILLAFLLGKIFFNLRAALIAAAIQAVIPIDMRSASMLIPDLIGAFWANLGILLIYYGSRKDNLISKSAYGILTGLTLGLAWLCKETVVYVVAFMVFYMLWLAYRQKRNAIIFVSAFLVLIIVLAAESMVYYKYTHDFFYRYRMIENVYLFDKASCGTTWVWEKGRYAFLIMLRRVFLDNPKAIFINPDFAFVTLTGLLGAGYAAFRKLGKFLLPGLWLLFLVFFFNFGSASLKSYRPLALYEYRYMYPLLLPAIILTAGLIDALIPAKKPFKQELGQERLFWGSVLAGAIFFISLFSVGKYMWQGRYSKVERVISRILAPEGLIIYTDARTAAALKLFWKYSSQVEMREFSGMEVGDIPAGAYVLINRGRVNFLNSRYGYILPQFYKNAPSSWLLRWDKRHAQLYQVPQGKLPQ